MTEQGNVRLVEEIYEAFGKGDIPAILKTFTPETKIQHGGLPGTVPWSARTYTGPDEWKEFFEALGGTFEPELFEPKQYVAQDDRVVALGQLRFRSRSTGKSFDSDWAMLWTFKDGKPISCHVFEDTEAQANAITGV